MKKLNPWVVLFPILNVLCLLFIKPLIIPFFTFSIFLKAVYILLVFGSPVWVAIPIGLLLLPFGNIGKKDESKPEKFRNRFSKAFIAVNIILFFFFGVLIYAKMVLLHDPFPKVKYDLITDKANDCSNIREGKFRGRYHFIERSKDHQTEYNFDYSDTIQYQLEWLSDYEYRLIDLNPTGSASDTIDMKVTNNTPTYYEGFIRVGEYAVYNRVDWQ
jgi:hypothetical protein